jgi:Zn finger protein HypA/HybF involved in hydrogenase expression
MEQMDANTKLMAAEGKFRIQLAEQETKVKDAEIKLKDLEMQFHMQLAEQDTKVKELEIQMAKKCVSRQLDVLEYDRLRSVPERCGETRRGRQVPLA